MTTALNNLAVLLVEQGRYADAESNTGRRSPSRSRKSAPADPGLAPMLTNLGTLSFYQGHYAEAQSLYRRALAIEEKRGSNPASTMNNLAVLYRAQARYSEAERLYMRALTIREKALGPQHPEIAKILTNLADLYTRQRQFSKAESMLRRALSIWEASSAPIIPTWPAAWARWPSFTRRRRISPPPCRCSAVRSPFARRPSAPIIRMWPTACRALSSLLRAFRNYARPRRWLRSAGDRRRPAGPGASPGRQDSGQSGSRLQRTGEFGRAEPLTSALSRFRRRRSGAITRTWRPACPTTPPC